MNKIKKGDTVVVLTGKDKGRSGTVLQMVTKTDRVLVQGVNMVKRHTRQSQTSEGGIIAKEASLHISNVALADPKDGKADTRWHQDMTKTAKKPALQNVQET